MCQRDVSFIGSGTPYVTGQEQFNIHPDMIDQIGGWTTAGAGKGYGEGYDLEVIKSYFISITLAPNKP